jgi:soluble lytic murein transglycosylase
MMKHKGRSGGKKIIRWFLGLCAVLVVLGLCAFVLLQRVFPRKYSGLVEKYAAEYQVETALVYAVIHTESGFDPNAVSVDDACGLMQMLPSTLEWMQWKLPGEREYVRADLFDPEISIRYGTYFLRELMNRFGNIEAVAAAYHAGPGAVARWLKNPDYSADGIHLDRIPYVDTAHYVKKITRAYVIYHDILRVQ